MSKFICSSLLFLGFFSPVYSQAFLSYQLECLQEEMQETKGRLATQEGLLDTLQTQIHQYSASNTTKLLEQKLQNQAKDTLALKEALLALEGEQKALSAQVNKIESILHTLLDAFGQPTTNSSDTSSQNWVVVKERDTLGKIAQRHHTSVEALKTRNELKSDKILPGQKLYLP